MTITVTAESTETIRQRAAVKERYVILGCSDAVPVRLCRVQTRQDTRRTSFLLQLEDAPELTGSTGSYEHMGLSLYYATNPLVRFSHFSLSPYPALPRPAAGYEWVRDYGVHTGVPAQLANSGVLVLTGRDLVLGRTRKNPNGSRVVEAAMAPHLIMSDIPRVEAPEVAAILASTISASDRPTRVGAGERIHRGIGGSTVIGVACGLHRAADGSTKPLSEQPSGTPVTCARCLAY